MSHIPDPARIEGVRKSELPFQLITSNYRIWFFDIFRLQDHWSNVSHVFSVLLEGYVGCFGSASHRDALPLPLQSETRLWTLHVAMAGTT